MHRQEFAFAGVIVGPSRGKPSGEECAGMGLLVLRRSLGEDCPDPGIVGVHLDHEGAAGVRMGEDRGRGKTLF